MDFNILCDLPLNVRKNSVAWCMCGLLINTYIKYQKEERQRNLVLQRGFKTILKTKTNGQRFYGMKRTKLQLSLGASFFL